MTENSTKNQNEREKRLELVVSIDNADENIKNFVLSAFDGLDILVSEYKRKMNGDFSAQIAIYLKNAVISGIAWDVIRSGISKIFKKYPKASIVIRDKDVIIYNISSNGMVNVLVTHDRVKEFSHIRHIHSLGRYLIEETFESKLEHRKRADMILGFIIAMILSFFVNVFSSVFYENFLVIDNEKPKYDISVVIWTVVGFFVAISFLQFIIYDYKNRLEINKSFLGRYLFFLGEDFLPFRIAQVANSVIMSVFAVVLFSTFSMIFGEYGYLIGGVIAYVGVIIIYYKKYKKQFIV